MDGVVRDRELAIVQELNSDRKSVLRAHLFLFPLGRLACLHFLYIELFFSFPPPSCGDVFDFRGAHLVS